MPYDFRCNTCNALLETEDRWVGRDTTCPGCGAHISVPRKTFTVQQMKPCPNCGENMKQNDVICEKCSFNIMTGKVKKRPLGYKLYRRKKIKDVTKQRIIINYPAMTLQITFYSFLIVLAVGAFFYLLMPNGKPGLYVSLFIIVAGVLCNFYSLLMWIWAWFKAGFLWLLLCFFIPVVNVLFIIVHWNRAKYALGMNVLAIVMVFAGAALAGPRIGGIFDFATCFNGIYGRSLYK